MRVYLRWPTSVAQIPLDVPSGSTVLRIYELAGGREVDKTSLKASILGQPVVDWSTMKVEPNQTVQFEAKR